MWLTHWYRTPHLKKTLNNSLPTHPPNETLHWLKFLILNPSPELNICTKKSIPQSCIFWNCLCPAQSENLKTQKGGGAKAVWSFSENSSKSDNLIIPKMRTISAVWSSGNRLRQIPWMSGWNWMKADGISAVLYASLMSLLMKFLGTPHLTMFFEHNPT